MSDNEDELNSHERFLCEPLHGYRPFPDPTTHTSRERPSYPRDAYGNPTTLKGKLQKWLDSQTPEQLRAEIDKRKHLQKVCINGSLVPIDTLSWWRKDRYGWPIETVKGRPFNNFCRLVCQNIRKIGI